MSDPVLKLQILARAEMALVHIRTQKVIKRAAFFAVALVFGLLGLALLNYSVFYSISKTQGPAMAALIVSLINIAVAVIMLVIADKSTSGVNDEKLAREIRDLAHNELNRDIDQVRDEFERISGDIQTIRSGFMTITGAAASTVGPLVKLLGKTVRKR